MNAGQIEQIGTPAEVYEAPRSSFVAAFIGDTNFFEGPCWRSSRRLHPHRHRRLRAGAVLQRPPDAARDAGVPLGAAREDPHLARAPGPRRPPQRRRRAHRGRGLPRHPHALLGARGQPPPRGLPAAGPLPARRAADPLGRRGVDLLARRRRLHARALQRGRRHAGGPAAPADRRGAPAAADGADGRRTERGVGGPGPPTPAEWLLTAPSLLWLPVLVLVPTVIVFAIAFKPPTRTAGSARGSRRARWPGVRARRTWRSPGARVADLRLTTACAWPWPRRWATSSPAPPGAGSGASCCWSWCRSGRASWCGSSPGRCCSTRTGAQARAGRARPGRPRRDAAVQPGAVLLVMVYTSLPFAILPIYAAAEKFDFKLLEAARDLGATPCRRSGRCSCRGSGAASPRRRCSSSSRRSGRTSSPTSSAARTRR